MNLLVNPISSVELLSRVWLCDPMDCSVTGFPAHHHQLPELAQNSCLLSRWCHLTILFSVIPFSSCLQSFPASGSFPVSQFFTSGGQSIGVSASASVLPMNIQDWFPLGLTSLISLQSKSLLRVFSNTTVQKHQVIGQSNRTGIFFLKSKFQWVKLKKILFYSFILFLFIRSPLYHYCWEKELKVGANRCQCDLWTSDTKQISMQSNHTISHLSQEAVIFFST